MCPISTRTFNERAAGPTGLHADRPHRRSPSEVGVEEFAVHLMEASALGDVRATRDLIRISAARSRPSATSPSFVGQRRSSRRGSRRGHPESHVAAVMNAYNRFHLRDSPLAGCADRYTTTLVSGG